MYGWFYWNDDVCEWIHICRDTRCNRMIFHLSNEIRRLKEEKFLNPSIWESKYDVYLLNIKTKYPKTPKKPFRDYLLSHPLTGPSPNILLANYKAYRDPETCYYGAKSIQSKEEREETIRKSVQSLLSCTNPMLQTHSFSDDEWESEWQCSDEESDDDDYWRIKSI